jgi:3-oxoacyl-[acyl-carrier protein] reductase
MEWRNQVAVVTGGARGLGRATARLLAQRGAAVCVNYAVHADAAEALVAEIATAGERAIAVAADVADAAAVEAMVARTEAELGPVTILVNNAGVAWQGTLDTYDREQVARMRQVNVDGVINATRAVMGTMRARHYGRIVNLASIAAIGTALSGNAFYAATKAEVVTLTRRFALELGQHGITVNAVAPGFVLNSRRPRPSYMEMREQEQSARHVQRILWCLWDCPATGRRCSSSSPRPPGPDVDRPLASSGSDARGNGIPSRQSGCSDARCPRCRNLHPRPSLVAALVERRIRGLVPCGTRRRHVIPALSGDDGLDGAT